MRRLTGNNLKIGGVIFLFSLLMTVAFAGAILWFNPSTNFQQATTDGLYMVSSAEYTDIMQNDGNLKINLSKFVGESTYQQQYLKTVLSRLVPTSLLFLTVLFFLSTCLWLVLKKMKNAENIKIAEQLNDVITDSIVSDNPALETAYNHIKQVFNDHFDDYKRLNSYLSHEQKNALSILRTNLELSENKEYLKNIDCITDSIDDVLTLSENADMATFSTVDVSLVCAEVCDSYQKIANIFFDFEESGLTEIVAKQRWIYRAVANLLDNAIKYGENNPIHVTVKTKKSSVIIAVQDNGIGISEEKQEMIFNNRYRINELNKDGYGIGLSLVSHVCDLCGGFVTVESKFGCGSTFYMSFPQKSF